MNKYSKIIIIIVLILFVLGSISVIASKYLLEYTEDGKPIVAYNQEIPEELKGKEVSIKIPANQEKVNEDFEMEDMQEEYNVLSNKIDEYSDEKLQEQYEQHQNLVQNFREILYKYHGKEKMDKLYAELNSTNTDVISNYEFPEAGKTLLQYVIDIFETMNPLETEKEILREYSQDIVKINDIKDEYLKNKILNL